MAFGVTPEGFVRKTFENILSEMQAQQRTTMYEDLDVSDESIVGQLNAIFANQLAEGWEQLEELYNAGDVDAAESRALENLCKLLGVYRVGVTKSSVVLTCTLAEGTTLVAGEHFAATMDQPDVRWTPIVDFTAQTSGPLNVIFEAENGGPIPAVAGSITNIATPIVGWSAVSQPGDATPGEYIQDDTELRRRRAAAVASPGSATIRAIHAALAAAIPDAVITVSENDTDYVDADGRPPHSIEALVFDGTSPQSENNGVIAQAIANTIAIGIATYGSSSGTAEVLDGASTVEKTIHFNRPSVKHVYLEFDITPGTGYPGDEALKEWIASEANRLHVPGVDVAWSLLSSLAFGIGGVARCTQLRLGFAPNPTDYGIDLDIALREVARFDTGRIVINT